MQQGWGAYSRGLVCRCGKCERKRHGRERGPYYDARFEFAWLTGVLTLARSFAGAESASDSKTGGSENPVNGRQPVNGAREEEEWRAYDEEDLSVELRGQAAVDGSFAKEVVRLVAQAKIVSSTMLLQSTHDLYVAALQARAGTRGQRPKDVDQKQWERALQTTKRGRMVLHEGKIFRLVKSSDLFVHPSKFPLLLPELLCG